MALEQSVNRDSRSKGGIIGISQNPQARYRRFLTNHERANITTAFKEMCCLNEAKENSTHKEGYPQGYILMRVSCRNSLVVLILG